MAKTKRRKSTAPTRKRYTDEDKQRVLDLYRELGVAMSVAELTGVGCGTVRKWVRLAGMSSESDTGSDEGEYDSHDHNGTANIDEHQHTRHKDTLTTYTTPEARKQLMDDILRTAHSRVLKHGDTLAPAALKAIATAAAIATDKMTILEQQANAMPVGPIAQGQLPDNVRTMLPKGATGT